MADHQRTTDPNEIVVRDVPLVGFEARDGEADGEGDGLTLSGHAAVFDQEARIVDHEGEYDEHFAPRAFRKTLRERQPVIQFDHGSHPMVGSIPIGPANNVREDDNGLWFETRLHDNWLVQPVRDAIRSGAISGASIRFQVVKDSWDYDAEPVPRRTIKEVRLLELGPVVFPAYRQTEVGVRSEDIDTTDRSTPDEGDADGAARGTPIAAPGAAAQGEPPTEGTRTAPTGKDTAAMADQNNEQQAPEPVAAPDTEDGLRAAITQLDESLRAVNDEQLAQLSDDDRQTVADAVQRRSEYQAKLDNIEQLRESLRTLAAMPSHHEPTTPDPLGQPGSVKVPKRGNPWDLDELTREMNHYGPSDNVEQVRGRAIQAVEHAAIDERSKQKITTLLDCLDFDDDFNQRGAKRVAGHIVATSSPEYMRAWTTAVRTGARTGTPDPQALGVLQRAASLTDASGGFAVPLPVDPTLLTAYDVDVHPFRDISTVRTIVTDQLRTVNSTAATFSWDGEAAEVSDDATTFAATDITVHKAQGFIPFSIEIGEDYPGFTEDIRMLFNDGKNDLEATAFATGTGTNQPIGIVTALTGGAQVQASAGADTFAVGDLYAVDELLGAQNRARATWVMNRAIMNDIRQFGTADSHALTVRLQDERFERLLGAPVREASAMDGTITALADNYIAVYGDFRSYYIVDRVGFSMELIPHLFATGNNRPSGQRGFYAYWRVGADSVRDLSFAMLNVT